jgi:hypothetical protein
VFDGLVGGAVLADADRVVGEDVDGGISMMALRRMAGRPKSEKTKKPAPKARTLERHMPETIAPMASSRTP